MTVVRITIKKNLIQGADFHRQSASGPFATEYLVRTEAPFPSPQLREYARSIAVAESRMYPSCVHFEGAIVKLSTPGASGDELRGQFSHVMLDGVFGPGQMRGQLEMGEDEVLAFPSVTAVYVRHAQWGRNGRLFLPHAFTTSEWNLYTQKRVLPPRFQRPNDFAMTPFSDELMEAIRVANGTYVMPGAAGDTEQSLRSIKNFFFDGFDVTPLKKRKKSSLAAKRAAQRRASLLGSLGLTESDNSEDVSPTASRAARTRKTKMPLPGVVYLLQGGSYFKIGKSVDFEKRLGQIKLQLPYLVEVVHTIRATNPSQVETHWHRRFAPLRRNGEWFELTEAEVNEFKSVSEM